MSVIPVGLIDLLVFKFLEVSRMNENVEKIKLPDDVKEFIRYATLEIQSHRNRTDQQKDNLFHRAYQLYVKYDVEN